MPDVIANVTIQAGRKMFPAGSVVPIKNPAEAARLCERGDAEPANGVGLVSDLPEDFPSRNILAGAGLSLDDVRERLVSETITEIDGIGEAKGDAIAEAVHALDADPDDDDGDDEGDDDDGEEADDDDTDDDAE